MKLNFYIIYSIDIPIDLNELWNEYEDYSTKELIELMKKESINLPFDEYEEQGDEDWDIDLEEMIPFSEYKETDEFFDEQYGEFREEMLELLCDQEKPIEEINKLLKEHLPYYITGHLDKFNETESDNKSDEFDYADLTTIHRKYTAELDEEEFIELMNNFCGCTTCNTIGSFTEFGWLPAFSIEIDSRDWESCYVCVLFSEELEEDKMEEIESKIREVIESGDLTLDYLNNL